jgi:hypothetical protein
MDIMKTTNTLRIALIAAAVLAAPLVQAQAPAAECSRSRAEVRDECIAFLKTHKWNDANSTWMLKSGQQPPEGVSTREEIRAQRDKFMSMNRWNDALSRWEPVGGTPRTISKLSRAEVRKETQAFMRTHEWDEASGSYVEIRKQ